MNSCPTWIPEDYALKVVTIRDIEQLLRITGVCSGERGELLIRVTYYKNVGAIDWTNAIERDDGGSVFIVDAWEYYVVTNSNQLKVGWIQDLCFYETSKRAERRSAAFGPFLESFHHAKADRQDCLWRVLVFLDLIEFLLKILNQLQDLFLRQNS